MTFVLGAAFGLPAIWATVEMAVSIPITTPPGVLGIISFGLCIVAVSFLYIDSELERIIHRVGESIEETDAYYELMTEFVRTLYRPCRLILAPFVSITVILLAVLYPFIDPITGVNMGIVLVIALVSAVVLSAYIWVIVVFTAFMSLRLRQFTVRLHVATTADHLGLKPYGEFVFRSLAINLTGYAVVATYVVVIADDPLMILFLLFGTVFAVTWFVGTQYGLHRAIASSKQKRLSELREEYGTDIRDWFEVGHPNPQFETVQSTAQFLSIKQEIERIPEWPNSNAQLLRAISLTAGTNLVSALPAIL